MLNIRPMPGLTGINLIVMMADQMILLHDGTCVAGTPEELAGHSRDYVTEFLGEDGRAFLARLHEIRDRGDT